VNLHGTLPAIGLLSSLILAPLAHGQIKENLDLPLDAGGGDGAPDEDPPEVVEFYSLPLEGDAFFYVIDRSSSMLELGELQRAKQEVLKNLAEFSEKVQFGIFFFDAGFLKFPESGKPADATPEMKQSAKRFIQSTPGGAGTCGLQPLLSALQMANLAKSRRKVLVYLSDGAGTCQGAVEAEYLEKMFLQVTSQNFQRVKINTIGVIDLTELGERFMRRLASANGGTYTRISR